MVALVAVDAAIASEASERRSFLSLPPQLRAYVRRAAWHVTVCRIVVIILRSVASISSGAIMYRFASSAVRRGKPYGETEEAVEAGAAVPDEAGVVEVCDCERVWRVVACKFGGAVAP
eukprot:874973-Pleurochrysis_carterae.AAC.1